MTPVEENKPQPDSMLLFDEEKLSALVSQTIEYSEDSEESPYFIASSYSE
ncbi:MAG TPA: hypothetical protein VMH80_23825 [Bryobacteraceae bacterium]|nr:hypothetical protein [Bryobacteraceae bacterium]